MISTRKRFAFNALMNWAATAVSMVVPFFLTPFVVRHLGPQSYGVWILAISTVSYLALLDLGLRSAVVRFVSKAQAQGKTEEAARIIGAALWIRLLIAGVTAVLSGLLVLATPYLFHIPAELTHAARVTVLMCALGVGITLVTGVFGAVLSAINRFDLLSALTMTQTVARASGVLLILRSGRGLVALAYWEFCVLLLAGLATALIARRILPSSRTRVTRPDASTLRALWSYSATTFLFMIAVQIVVNTDNLVVGAFLSIGMVAFYSIGSSLVTYTTQVAGAVSTMFTPIASALEASGRFEDLQPMLLRGTQAMLGLVGPIATVLVFRGRTFITLWMGPRYGVISETVLQILMISLFFSMANSTAGAIAMAIDKHKPVARSAICEAIFNLVLSIILVKTVGLYGVAWGTSISMGLTHLVFWPRYVRKTFGVPIRTFVWEGWLKITLCCLPFGAVCLLEDWYWRTSNLAIFFAQIVATLPIYAFFVLLVFRRETRSLLLQRRLSRPVQV